MEDKAANAPDPFGNSHARQVFAGGKCKDPHAGDSLRDGGGFEGGTFTEGIIPDGDDTLGHGDGG